MSDLQNVPARISFDGAISIRNIAAARGDMLQALSLHTTVHVDCSAIESADVSFIQVLLAARCSAQRAGKQLRLHPPPTAAFRDALLRGGFLRADDMPAADGDSFWSGG